MAVAIGDHRWRAPSTEKPAVGLGALVRNQVVAVVGVLVLGFLGEPTVTDSVRVEPLGGSLAYARRTPAYLEMRELARRSE